MYGLKFSLTEESDQVLTRLCSHRLLQGTSQGEAISASTKYSKVLRDDEGQAQKELEVPSITVDFLDVLPSSRAIEVSGADFSWTNSPENLSLSGINLSIDKGEMIAIVGAVGMSELKLFLDSIITKMTIFDDCTLAQVPASQLSYRRSSNRSKSCQEAAAQLMPVLPLWPRIIGFRTILYGTASFSVTCVYLDNCFRLFTYLVDVFFKAIFHYLVCL